MRPPVSPRAPPVLIADLCGLRSYLTRARHEHLEVANAIQRSCGSSSCSSTWTSTLDRRAVLMVDLDDDCRRPEAPPRQAR